jgi:hypothetical protein
MILSQRIATVCVLALLVATAGAAGPTPAATAANWGPITQVPLSVGGIAATATDTAGGRWFVLGYQGWAVVSFEGEKLATMPVMPYPESLALSTDATQVYVSDGFSTVRRYSTATYKQVGAFAFEGQMSLAFAGGRLWSARARMWEDPGVLLSVAPDGSDLREHASIGGAQLYPVPGQPDRLLAVRYAFPADSWAAVGWELELLDVSGGDVVSMARRIVRYGEEENALMAQTVAIDPARGHVIVATGDPTARTYALADLTPTDLVYSAGSDRYISAVGVSGVGTPYVHLVSYDRVSTFAAGKPAVIATATPTGGVSFIGPTNARGTRLLATSYSDGEHDALTVLPGPAVNAPGLALTLSAKAVRYGSKVTATATLARHSAVTKNRTVTFYAKPYGKKRVLLGTAELDSNGRASLRFAPQRHSQVQAVYRGDEALVADSASAAVKVRLAQTAVMRGHHGRQGRYYLYDASRCPTRRTTCPRVSGVIRPAHGTMDGVFVMDYLDKGKWKRIIEDPFLATRKDSTYMVWLRAAGGMEGHRYRIRHRAYGDEDHLMARTPWRYFKLT